MTAEQPDDAFRRAFPPEPGAPVDDLQGRRPVPPAPLPSGQPGYGEPANGQSAYGQLAPDQPGYPEPGYGQPGYAPPAYGEPGYGAAPAYGQPAYGEPGYGTPSYRQAAYPPVPYVGAAPYAAHSPYGYAVSPKSPALALLASFFVPGLGSMINGDVAKGVGILVGYLVSWLLTIVLVGFVGLLGFWIWGMVDGYSGAQAWNARHGIVS